MRDPYGKGTGQRLDQGTGHPNPNATTLPRTKQTHMHTHKCVQVKLGNPK